MRQVKALIIGSKKTRTTGHILSRVMNGKYIESIIPEETVNNYNFIWRWGNAYTQIPRTYGGYIMNKATPIGMNKATMRIKLLENGFPCPKFINISHVHDAKYPLIARPVYHMKGRDFNIVENATQAIAFLEHGYYLQEIIENKEEFRIFMYDKRVLECNIKVLVRTPRNPINKLIKNFRNGYIFKVIKMATLPHDLIEYCRGINSCVGLNFSAIDCCISKSGTPFFFEVNSAPGLIERKAIKFCDKILSYVGFSPIQRDNLTGITPEDIAEIDNGNTSRQPPNPSPFARSRIYDALDDTVR